MKQVLHLCAIGLGLAHVDELDAFWPKVLEPEALRCASISGRKSRTGELIRRLDPMTRSVHERAHRR